MTIILKEYENKQLILGRVLSDAKLRGECSRSWIDVRPTYPRKVSFIVERVYMIRVTLRKLEKAEKYQEEKQS